ncbi:response regulator [Glycomyces buryatensis]|uniref:Response regulator transcription factor n=1 Tax=Glycomyces buryatensis TaxID=2570927 RepID=A0A4S8QJN8_9ACTN|nr:response regulator transcription factor [Glycomyces buryatensis]THV41609.1 response regulator transcription factor [Glycomyces buryatensis]
MIRVLLADDQPLMRGGFRALIEAEDDMTVVGEAADGPAAVALAAETRPDVALLDVEMPGGDGITAVRQIAADPDLAELRVVMLTNYSFDSYVFDALRAGAAGYLVKDTEPEELLRCVRAAAAGEMLLSPAIASKLVAEYVAHPPARLAGKIEALTGRETEIVALVARGLSNGEIAERLFISPATAKTHVHRAMMKLQVRDRAGLVVFAYESGLVQPKENG